MNEPITLAKVRKETKITVPAGGWVILVSPNEHFSSHENARRKLVGNVNDDYEKVVMGRLRNYASDLRFLTKEQKENADKEMALANKAYSKATQESDIRQKKIQDSELKKEADAHKERVAEQNKINDSIRERK